VRIKACAANPILLVVVGYIKYKLMSYYIRMWNITTAKQKPTSP